MEHNRAAQAAAGLLAPQRSESRTESALSERPQSSSGLSELAELMEQMAGRYPHQDMEAAAKNYLFDYGRLMEKHGLPAVKTALLNLRIKPGQKFFPTPDEAATELEAMAKTQDSQVKFQADPNCECRKVQKGWTWVLDKDGERVIGRCPCYRAHMGYVSRDHKMAAVGVE